MRAGKLGRRRSIPRTISDDRARAAAEDVDVAALQREDLRLLLGIELDLLAVELRDPALVPVVGVLDVRDAGVRRVAVELPRPGARERLLPLPAEVLRDDDRVVVVGAEQVGEVAVRRVELEALADPDEAVEEATGYVKAGFKA